MVMKRTRVGLYSGVGIVMLAVIGCNDNATTSINAAATQANTALPGSAAASDGRVSVDLPSNRTFSPSRVEALDFNTLTIGGSSEGLNIFPFGGGFGSSNRYQQAYAAAQFNSSAPVLISSISFLDGRGTFAPSTYTFSLSTISTGIDDLDLTNFDANRGTDNTMLASVNLAGAAPATLRIEGATPFLYDPSRGNLLLDIAISPGGVSAVSLSGAGYASRITAYGMMSRYHNFGTGFIGYGLITQFQFAPLTLDNVIGIVDQAVEDGALTGTGNASANRLGAWINMLKAAQRSADDDDNDSGSCALLEQAYLRADGASVPPDFVRGSSAQTIANLIQTLRTTLSCN
jgi:hypothetical protein